MSSDDDDSPFLEPLELWAVAVARGQLDLATSYAQTVLDLLREDAQQRWPQGVPKRATFMQFCRDMGILSRTQSET